MVPAIRSSSLENYVRAARSMSDLTIEWRGEFFGLLVSERPSRPSHIIFSPDLSVPRAPRRG